MNRIRKGDKVVITSGREKGRTVTIIKVLEGDRVVVENVNMVKKHQKPNPARGVAGAIVQREAPIRASNVALWNPATKKADRGGFRSLEDGRKVRYFKSHDDMVD